MTPVVIPDVCPMCSFQGTEDNVRFTLPGFRLLFRAGGFPGRLFAAGIRSACASLITDILRMSSPVFRQVQMEKQAFHLYLT